MPALQGMRGVVAVTLAEWPAVVYRGDAAMRGLLASATTGETVRVNVANTDVNTNPKSDTAAAVAAADVPEAEASANGSAGEHCVDPVLFDSSFLRCPLPVTVTDDDARTNGRSDSTRTDATAVPTEAFDADPDSLFALPAAAPLPDLFPVAHTPRPLTMAPARPGCAHARALARPATAPHSILACNNNSIGSGSGSGNASEVSYLFPAGSVVEGTVLPFGVLLQFAQDVLLQLRTIHTVGLYHAHLQLPINHNLTAQDNTSKEVQQQAAAKAGVPFDREQAKAGDRDRARAEKAEAKRVLGELSRRLLSYYGGVPTLRLLADYHYNSSTALKSENNKSSKAQSCGGGGVGDSRTQSANVLARAVLPCLGRLSFIAPPASVADAAGVDEIVRRHVLAEAVRARAKQGTRGSGSKSGGAGAGNGKAEKGDGRDDDDEEHEEEEDAEGEDQDSDADRDADSESETEADSNGKAVKNSKYTLTPADITAASATSIGDCHGCSTDGSKDAPSTTTAPVKTVGTFRVTAHRQGHHARALTSTLAAIEVGGYLQDAYALSCDMEAPDVNVRLDFIDALVLVSTQLGRQEPLSRRHKKSFINIVTLKTNLACAMSLLAFPTPAHLPLLSAASHGVKRGHTHNSNISNDAHDASAECSLFDKTRSAAYASSTLISPRPDANADADGDCDCESNDDTAEPRVPGEPARFALYEPCLHCGSLAPCRGYGWRGMWRGMLPAALPFRTAGGAVTVGSQGDDNASSASCSRTSQILDTSANTSFVNESDVNAFSSILSVYPPDDLPTAAFAPGPNTAPGAYTGPVARTLTILDPFCGGGTVLTEAAYMLGVAPYFPSSSSLSPSSDNATQKPEQDEAAAVRAEVSAVFPAPSRVPPTQLLHQQKPAADGLYLSAVAQTQMATVDGAGTGSKSIGKAVKELVGHLDISQTPLQTPTALPIPDAHTSDTTSGISSKDANTAAAPVAAAAAAAAAAATTAEVLSAFAGVHTGAGTVVRLIGLDANNRAVRGARANAAAEGVGHALRFAHHDARALHTALPADSVDAIVTNAPWGQHTATATDQTQLLGQFLASAWRVLKPGARCVMLVLRSLLALEVARQSGLWRIAHVRIVQTTNNLPGVLVLEKVAVDPVKEALLAELGLMRAQVDIDRAMFGAIVSRDGANGTSADKAAAGGGGGGGGKGKGKGRPSGG